MLNIDQAVSTEMLTPCRQCKRLDEIDDESVKVCNIHLEGISSEDRFQKDKIAEAYVNDPELRIIYKLLSESEQQTPWQEIVGADGVTKAYWTVWER